MSVHVVCLPFLVPEFRYELLIALTQCRLLICPHQPAAVQEELSKRRTGKKGEDRVDVKRNVEVFFLYI